MMCRQSSEELLTAEYRKISGWLYKHLIIYHIGITLLERRSPGHGASIETPYLSTMAWPRFLCVCWMEDFHEIFSGPPEVIQCR